MAIVPINMQKGTVNDPESEIIVGIDLGTTNSLIAYVKDGKPEVIKTPGTGAALVPSVLYFAPDGRILVGDEAKKYLLEDPKNTIFSVKRLMGKSFGDIRQFKDFFGYQIIDDDTESLVKIRVKDKFYTPVELSALILKALKQHAEQVLNRPVTKAVITVPAYFNDNQRQATRDAGKLAGLDVLRIVNEPTAASLVYGLGDPDAPARKVAVYDLGGGTFDISILEIGGGIYEVLSTHGDTFLGGDDFDRAIIRHWAETGAVDATHLNQDKAYGQAVRLAAETAKKQLSDTQDFSTTLQGKHLSITRDQFEALIRPLIRRTIDLCGLALKDAKLNPEDIEAIVLVGGSTRVPAVKQAVTTFFKKADKSSGNKALKDYIHPDETVALGAAIQADILAGNNKNALLLDITPLSLGIETIGGLMDVIVPRNTKIPIKVGREYTTSVDGQTKLKVAVYQGERQLVKDNRKLGEFILSGIPPMPAGIPKIEIGFIIDADGVLNVRAREKRSGIEQTVRIRSQYGLPPEQIAQMLKESVRHAKEDMAVKALLEARNEAKHVIQSTDKFIAQHRDIIPDEALAEIQRLKENLQDAVRGDDKDLINARLQALNDFAAPFAHLAMDKVVREAMKGKKAK